jgi:hypothetical protein
MGQSEAPILEALAAHRGVDRYGFTPSGHSPGRGGGDILSVGPTP